MNDNLNLRETFTRIMRATTQRDVTSFVCEHDGDIIRVRINNDDAYTYAGVFDGDAIEFHHASFDDRFIVRVTIR
jgi:hypothetical protein